VVLEDKLRFLRHFRPFVRRLFVDRETLRRDPAQAQALLTASSGRVVVKDASGQCGAQVKVLDTAGLDAERLLAFMKRGGYDLAEGYVTQHPDLMALSPSALNTIRVITQIGPRRDVRLLGVRLRISVNCAVDKMSAPDNVAAPVDPERGIVDGPAVHLDITRADIVEHPVTGVPIVGLQLPFWPETLAMVTQAARTTDNRAIGWDVAVTADGPELIEANHNWGSRLWQLPVNRGLKHMLEPLA
jgi:hypothetical protein